MLRKLFLMLPVILVLIFIPSIVEAYTVQKGDTLSEIAMDHHLSLNQIVELNPDIENPDLIYPGDRIHIDGNQEKSADQSDKKQNTAEDSESKTKVKDKNTGNTSSRASEEAADHTDIQTQNTLSEEEKDLFARVVHAEARGESFEGKVAVAHVILNRVEDNQFPNTVYEVIRQPGQFQPVRNGKINQPAGQEAVKAVEEALQNRSHRHEALYFYNPDHVTHSWILSTETVAEIGNHVFSR
jgi:N-acetylmuramoyl-L-alanine amidase